MVNDWLRWDVDSLVWPLLKAHYWSVEWEPTPVGTTEKAALVTATKNDQISHHVYVSTRDYFLIDQTRP